MVTWRGLNNFYAIGLPNIQMGAIVPSYYLFIGQLVDPKNQKNLTEERLIELNKIDCSLMIGAGKGDQMVTVASVQPLVQLTNSQDVTFTLIPGGHLGLMSSQSSANEFWPLMTTWLKQRSSKI